VGKNDFFGFSIGIQLRISAHSQSKFVKSAKMSDPKIVFAKNAELYADFKFVNFKFKKCP